MEKEGKRKGGKKKGKSEQEKGKDKDKRLRENRKGKWGKKKYKRKRHKCNSGCFILRSPNSLLCSTNDSPLALAKPWCWPGTIGDTVCLQGL